MAAMITVQHTSVTGVIKDAAQALEAYGDVRFVPDLFGRSRMDLLFSPGWGPRVGCIYLVEHRTITPGTCLPSPEIAYPRSKQPTLREWYTGHDVHVVVATNGLIGNGGRRMVEDEDSMELLPGIESGAELAEEVARLAGMTG